MAQLRQGADVRVQYLNALGHQPGAHRAGIGAGVCAAAAGEQKFARAALCRDCLRRENGLRGRGKQ